jgi:hypothetical protein
MVIIPKFMMLEPDDPVFIKKIFEYINYQIINIRTPEPNIEYHRIN